MFVNNEITERGLLHRLLVRVSDEVTTEERMAWARSIDGAIKDAASPAVPLRNRVARPVVVLGAAPALSAVAAALRNEDLVISRESLDAVREFMTRRDRLPALRPRSAGRPPRRRCAAPPARRCGGRPARRRHDGCLKLPNLLSLPP